MYNNWYKTIKELTVILSVMSFNNTKKLYFRNYSAVGLIKAFIL